MKQPPTLLDAGLAGLVVIVMATAIAVPRPAEASVDGTPMYYLVGIPEGLLLLGGATTIIGNAVYVARPERPPIGWRVMGYVNGGLNAGAMIFWTISAIANADDSGGNDFEMALGLGIAHLAVAAANFALAGYGGTLDEAPRPPPVSLMPLIRAGRRDGDVTIGLGLRWSVP